MSYDRMIHTTHAKSPRVGRHRPCEVLPPQGCLCSSCQSGKAGGVRLGDKGATPLISGGEADKVGRADSCALIAEPVHGRHAADLHH